MGARKRARLHFRFIAASSPRASLVRVNERVHQTNGGIRVLVEGSVSALVVGAWLWGVVALGGHAAAVQASSPMLEDVSADRVVACPVPRTPADESIGCAGKFRHLVGTSREPGAGLTERPPGGES
jgi:hypothetical protein